MSAYRFVTLTCDRCGEIFDYGTQTTVRGCRETAARVGSGGATNVVGTCARTARTQPGNGPSEGMKTMSESIRERLARVLWESMSGAEIDWREHADTDYRRYADDLLAEFPMLAGVTDSMVEAGAKAMLDCWEIDGDPPSLHEQARAVLEAVYGKEHRNE